MNAEFNWWLLIVGVVVGAGLAWLVLADSARREREVMDEEVPAEAGWLARTLAHRGVTIDPDLAETVLRAHREYLGMPPPDALVDPDTLEQTDAGPTDVSDAAPRPRPAGPPPSAPAEGPATEPRGLHPKAAPRPPEREGIR